MRRLQQGFCKWESIKTKSYSSTRHRKEKQKKQREVWFLTGKMSPRAKCSHYCSPLPHQWSQFPPAQLSEESAPTLQQLMGTGTAIPSSFLHGHLHKAEEESPAEAQVTPKHTKCLSCGNTFPVSLCPCSAHWAVIPWIIATVLSSAALDSVPHHAGWTQGWTGLASLLPVLH